MASDKPCRTEPPGERAQGQCKFQSPELTTFSEMRASIQLLPTRRVVRSVRRSGLSAQ